MIERHLPPIPESAVPLQRRSELGATALATGRSLARLALRRRRTAARVSTEYNDGAWSDVLSGAAWRDATSLEEFLVGADVRPMVARLHGTAVTLPRRDYYRWRMEALRSIARDMIPDGQLVELGSGFGLNLFTLAADIRLTPLRGYDISTVGTTVGRQMAEHFGITNLTFGEIDLTDTSNPIYQEIEGATVLTYYCLEQLPDHVDRVVAAIADASPRRVVHIESAAGLLRLSRLADIATAVYVRSMDYQRSLVSTLDRMAHEGKIRLLHKERMTWGPTLHNDPVLLAWESA